MDQLKEYLAIAKKHHFWVLTGLISLVGLGVWYVTTADLKDRTEKQRAKEVSNFEQMSRILRQDPLDVNEGTILPNRTTVEGMEQNITRLRQEVYLAWVEKYKRQKDLLKWPTELGDDFIREVQPLWPIEEKLPPGRRDEILSIGLRERYRDYIKEELPKLAEVIHSGWKPRDEDAAVPKEDANAASSTEIVKWAPTNQRNIQTKHFDWSDKADLDPPTTLEILYAQEDLWVLRALMEVIATTNAGADAHHEAAIRQIHFINIGKNALGRIGKISKIEADSADQEELGEAGDGGAQLQAEQARAAALNSSDPAEGRYVDAEYKPLPAERLRNAVSSNAPEDAYLTVAKRMPVQMRFTMDQRRINELLVNCGNADLMVEVRQVRVERKGSGESDIPVETEEGVVKKEDPYPWDMDVELYGILYIYNPEHRERIKLSEDQVPEVEEPAGETPVSENPATPPTAAPAGNPTAPPVEPPTEDPAGEPDPVTPPEPADVTSTTPGE